MPPNTQQTPPVQPSVDDLIAAERVNHDRYVHELEEVNRPALTRLVARLAATPKGSLIAMVAVVLLIAGGVGAVSLQHKVATVGLADEASSTTANTESGWMVKSGLETSDSSEDTGTATTEKSTGSATANPTTGKSNSSSSSNSTKNGTATSPSTKKQTTTPSTNQTTTPGTSTTPVVLPAAPIVSVPVTNPVTSGGLLQPYGLGFAPYAYIPWGTSISAARGGSGAKHLVAAFVLAAGSRSCTPAWDGDSSLGINSSRGNQIASDFTAVRAAGADVVLSFGGASGTELAIGCTSASSLQTAYQSVITKYNLTKIDFDIEGSAVSNSAANTRRATALLALQKANPQLKIWLTLAVEQSGIPSSSLTLVRQMRDTGVVISGVNIMAMDYGTGVTQMGQAAINATSATFTQLKSIYTTSTDAQIRKAIGVTVMIGINDTKPETFTLSNATQLRTYATQQGIGMLSYWNTDRDKACAGNAAKLSDTCSGVTQSTWQFAQSLMLQPSY